MATYTPNLNLKKPSTSEHYDVVGDLNDSKDKIDLAVGNLSKEVKDIKLRSSLITLGQDVRYIAHRGLSSIAPENSLPAYVLAAQNGFYGGECDVQTTSDGEWVLMHDSTVDRTTNGAGAVNTLTLAQIKNLKIDAGPNVARYPNLRVPTLQEYLEKCKRHGLVPVIEIKDQAYTVQHFDDFINIIQKYGFEEKCIVISFSLPILQEIRDRSTKIVLQYVVGAFDQTTIDAMVALGNAGIDANVVTKAGIELAHYYGVHVNIWTVNLHQDAKTYTNYGVDFITTDVIGEVI